MGSGEWGVGSGEWGVGSGENKFSFFIARAAPGLCLENGEWGVGCGEWGTRAPLWGLGAMGSGKKPAH
jgi:hypothetical protein